MPPFAQVPVEKVAHRPGQEGREVHAVRDVRDRNLVGGNVVVERPPHLARDLTVQATDAVRAAGETQRERCHPGPLLGTWSRSAEVEEGLARHSEPRRQISKCHREGLRVVGLVACGDGRVRREDAAGSRVRERGLELDTVRHVLGGELERGECGMTLVEVEDPRVDSEHPQRPDGADPEERVLPEPRVRIALVEARGDPAVEWIVLVQLRVEQVERHTADRDAPDVERDAATVERKRPTEGNALVVEHLHRREVLRDRLCPVLVLVAGAVEALLEVALAIEEPDPDERDREVARLLEDVAGKRAQPTRVDRQRRVDPELRANECHRPVDSLDRSRRAIQVVVDRVRQPCDLGERRRIAGGAHRGGVGEIL